MRAEIKGIHVLLGYFRFGSQESRKPLAGQVSPNKQMLSREVLSANPSFALPPVSHVTLCPSNYKMERTRGLFPQR